MPRFIQRPKKKDHRVTRQELCDLIEMLWGFIEAMDRICRASHTTTTTLLNSDLVGNRWLAEDMGQVRKALDELNKVRARFRFPEWAAMEAHLTRKIR